MRLVPLLFTWFFCSVLVGLVSQVGAADEPKQDALTGEQILDRMAKTYADCKTYRDSGVCKKVIKNGVSLTQVKPFKTAFVRPEQFRFEYYDKEGAGPNIRYIVWRKGKEIQTWCDIIRKPGAEVEKPESFLLAIAGATGVSGGSADTIPALLLPKELIGGSRLTQLKEAKRIDDGNLEKVECFRIQAKYTIHPVTVWIEKKSFLVRRIDAEMKLDKFRIEETTTYEPIINGAIPDKVLEFDPPKAK